VSSQGYSGFCIDRLDFSPEASNISVYCLVKDIELLKIKADETSPLGYIPSGSVEFCSRALGRNITPDYYPEWCKSILYRKVWRSDKWSFEKVFVKPADSYKRFTGYVNQDIPMRKEDPPIWNSEVVEFRDEYRYYVSNGKIVSAHWYMNKHMLNPENPDPPNLDIEIPTYWCGTIDLGYLSTGELALVECHAPMACGWYGYGCDIEVYMQWLVDGWLSLNSKAI
jgi:hypothetical protein